MTKTKKTKFAATVVMLLTLSFLFGGATAFVTYATGKEVAYIPYMAMVSHTEYRFSEPGQIIARIVDFQGAPVAVTNCTATILYPDKTIFVNEQLMTASVNITGDYYYAFTTPNGPEGTYEYQATCNYGGGGALSRSVTNSFHLSSAFTSVLGNLSNINTDLTDVLNNLTLIENDLDQLSTDLFSINTSLSNEISGVSNQITSLSSQLNDNTTQVLNAISNINASIVGDISSVANTVINALSAGSYFISSEDYQTYSWNTTDSFFVNDDGSDAVIAIQASSGNIFAREGASMFNVSGSDVTFVLNTSAFTSSDDERYGDTTYELWFYDPGVYPLSNFAAIGMAWDGGAWYGPLLDMYNQNSNQYHFKSDGGSLALDNNENAYVDATEGWHLVQWYWLENKNGGYDIMTYFDNTLVLESRNITDQYPQHNMFVYTSGGNSVLVDGYRVYKGEPDRMSAVAENVMDTLANTESIITTLTSMQTTLAELKVGQAQINTTVNSISSGLTDFRAVYDGNVTLQNALLYTINTTTVDTYSYVTGTLTLKVDDALTQLGIINATVNRIETTTGQINNTVNQILTNQQNEVFMDVFSG